MVVVIVRHILSVDAEDHSKPTHQRGPWTPGEIIDQPSTQQEHSVIDQTDQETDKADVEPVHG
jgi:hypothetical protein